MHLPLRSWYALFLASALSGCGASDLTLPGTPGAPASVTIVRGNAQEGPVGAPLRDSLIVKVTDADGNAVPAQQVAFILADDISGAEVSPGSTVTLTDGTAASRWVLGGKSGTQEVVARLVGAAGADPLEVRFTASALLPAAPGADRLALRREPLAAATSGIELGRQPVVQIQDASGNDVPRSGVAVTAAIASGDGTLLGTTTQLTSSSGAANFNDLRINGPGGSHVLIFAADGYASVSSSIISVEPAPGGGGGGGSGGGSDADRDNDNDDDDDDDDDRGSQDKGGKGKGGGRGRG